MHEPPQEQFPPRRQGMSPWIIVLIVLGGCGTIGIAVIAIVAAILFPVFAQAREAARSASCQSNLKQISTAILMYAQDYDEVLPPKSNWQDGVDPYVRNPAVYTCPSAPGLPNAYAYNSRLDRRSMDDIPFPAAQPMVFESHLGARNGSDELGSFALRHFGEQSGNVAYADGHVRRERAPPPAEPDGPLEDEEEVEEE
jgi:prepilin-type processing-associated H-X9-DG protein